MRPRVTLSLLRGAERRHLCVLGCIRRVYGSQISRAPSVKGRHGDSAVHVALDKSLCQCGCRCLARAGSACALPSSGAEGNDLVEEGESAKPSLYLAAVLPAALQTRFASSPHKQGQSAGQSWALRPVRSRGSVPGSVRGRGGQAGRVSRIYSQPSSRGAACEVSDTSAQWGLRRCELTMTTVRGWTWPVGSP